MEQPQYVLRGLALVERPRERNRDLPSLLVKSDDGLVYLPSRIGVEVVYALIACSDDDSPTGMDERTLVELGFGLAIGGALQVGGVGQRERTDLHDTFSVLRSAA